MCRFCAKPAKNKNKTGKEKLLFTNEFLSFGVNLEEDDSVHPRLLCQSFSRNLYRPPSELKKVPFVWEPHSEENENCVCLGWTKGTRGRPNKRKAEQLKSDNDNDTDSTAEEEDKQETRAVFFVRYRKIFWTKNWGHPYARIFAPYLVLYLLTPVI